MPPKETEKGRGGARRNRRRGGRSHGGNPNGASKSNAGRAPRSSAVAVPEASRVSDAGLCSVCAEPAKDWAVGTCGHAVCGNCSHRMRILYKREACVMCITLLTEVTVVPAASFIASAPYEEVRALSTAHDSAVGMHFVDPARCKELQDVRGFKCSVCLRVESSSSKLKQHARSSHASLYCDVCFYGGSAFVSELPLFPLAGERGGCPALREHTKKTHPMCRFCNKYFLNDDKLYAHLQEQHESCFICEREGRLHEYYRSFPQLEAHYMTDHFICRDPGCRAVVFATKADLKAHEVQRHMTGVPRNARRVRVELDDLGPRVDPEEELRQERNRQSARRRAFMASQVVFTGSTDEDRSGDDGGGSSSSARFSRCSEPGSSAPARAQNPQPSQPQRGSQAQQPQQSRPERSTNPVRERRSPDDDAYYPLPLPQNQVESNERSRVLVRRMRSALDPAAFEQFRSCSGQFRNGEIDAATYYDAIIDAFGVRFAIREMLPELIALLPDADKRQALSAEVSGRRNSGSSANGALAPPQSSSDFPELEGARPSAPSLTPIARGPYRPVPQANDFPRLNRINKSGGDSGAASAAAPSNAPRQAPDMRRVFGASPAPVSATARAPLRLRQAITPHARMPAQALAGANAFPSLGGSSRVPAAPPPQRTAFPALGTGSVPRAAAPPAAQTEAFPSLGGGNRAQPAASASAQTEAFPSLGGGNRARPAAASASGPRAEAFPSLGGVNTRNGADESAEPGTVDADVTNRAGAVWGGTAPSSRRRRGPGGRVPAPMPGGAGPSESKRAVVVDVMEVARAQRKKLDNSALPKVNSIGGFAWEKKKNMKKKKEIKSAFAGSGSDSDSTRGTALPSTAPSGTSSGQSSRARSPDDAVAHVDGA